jgi:hypothetical protein
MVNIYRFFQPEVIFARVYGDVYEDRYNTVYRDLSPNGYNGYSAYNVLEQMVEAFQMNDGTAFSWSNPRRRPILTRTGTPGSMRISCPTGRRSRGGRRSSGWAVWIRS